MPRPRPPTLAVACLLVLAGCATGGQPATTPASPTTATTDADALRESPVFAYENLSAQSRRAFRTIRAVGTVDAAAPMFGPHIAARHYNVIRVRADGTVYRIRHQRQQAAVRTCLLGVRQVSRSAIDPAAVRAYENLSADARRVFDRVRTTPNASACYRPTAYPLRNVTAVAAGDTYYALEELHGSTTVHHYRLTDQADS